MIKHKDFNDITENRVFENGKDNRYCYAFVLYVNHRVKGCINADYWADENQADSYKWGLATAARAFQKTAEIAVYVKSEYTLPFTGVTLTGWRFEGGTVDGRSYVTRFYEEADFPTIVKK